MFIDDICKFLKNLISDMLTTEYCIISKIEMICVAVLKPTYSDSPL